MLWKPASSSVYGENAVDLWNGLSMFEPVGESSESERLRLRHGIIVTGAVGKHTWKVENFADPAAIFLTIHFNGEFAHAAIVQPTRVRREIPTRGRFRALCPCEICSNQ